MDLALAGKTALVTGAGGGIGSATARALAREGVNVVLAARTQDTVASLARELAADFGVRTLPLAADTTDDRAVRAMAAEAAATFGRVDILVNAAARSSTPPGGTLEHLQDHDFLAEFDTKVLGYARCARAVLPSMRHAGGGVIVNVVGIAARQAASIIGSSRNAAVSALTKNLSLELRADRIRVLAVHPGPTLTDRLSALIHDRAQAGGTTPETVAATIAGPGGRLLSVDEIADAIVFLASPRASAIDGESVSLAAGHGTAIHY